MNIALTNYINSEADMICKYISSYALINKATCMQYHSSYISKNSLDKLSNVNINMIDDMDSFLTNYEPLSYSLIFIWVNSSQPSDRNGLNIAHFIRQSDNITPLILICSDDKYMHEALHIHAYDYITKPFTKEKFIDIFTQLFPITNPLVTNTDIMYVESDGHYIIIHDSKNNNHTKRATLKTFMKGLDNSSSFLQINRGLVVNLYFVENIDFKNCILKNGLTLPISVRRQNEILNLWKNYISNKNR